MVKECCGFEWVLEVISDQIYFSKNDEIEFDWLNAFELIAEDEMGWVGLCNLHIELDLVKPSFQ